MDNQVMKPHWTFWLVSGIFLLWNLGGSMNFLMQMNPENLEMYRDVEKAIITDRPWWGTFGFGLGVFGGVIGCVMLLLRMSRSFEVLVASLIGVVIAVIHTLTVDAEFTTAELIVMTAMPIAFSGLMVWYAVFVKNKGWVKG